MSSPRANDWLARRRAEGATIRVLANELGVGPDRVAAAVHAAGLPPVRRNGSHPSFPELYDEDWIHAELATKTRTQVAAELGCRSTVCSLPNDNCGSSRTSRTGSSESASVQTSPVERSPR
jgi:hypothetical protein